MIWIVGRVDEKGVCHRYSTMEQQKQQKTNKFKAMHKALRDGTQTASRVEEFKRSSAVSALEQISRHVKILSVTGTLQHSRGTPVSRDLVL